MVALVAIFGAAWLLVLIGAILIFEFIVPVTICGCFFDGVVKAGLAAILGAVWLLIMVAMRNLLVRKSLYSKSST